MTKPDSLRRQRNSLAVIAVISLAASFGLAYSANFWLAILDYWKVWMMIASGFGGIGTAITAAAMHCEMLNELRDN